MKELKTPKCLNCGKKMKPYIYKKSDGFPKLVGKSDGHTYRCSCMSKGLLLSAG